MIRMTTQEKIARGKLSLLELAKVLGNVSKAFKIVCYQRGQIYPIRRNIQTFRAYGLLDQSRATRIRAPKGLTRR